MFMKRLASGASRAWVTAPMPECFAGDRRIETRNTVYLMRDGVCHSTLRRDFANATGTHNTDLVGMRLMGWVASELYSAPLQLEWALGMHAVLWRPRRPGERHSLIALTSQTLAFLPL
jgi:hypothetical protein